MAGHGPPRHRHDGGSPLPLGMDYSPPPSHWIGPHSVWPHDPRTGWSYCVMIPSWTTLSDAKTADSHLANPIVFYRVQVGVQSPQGVSTTRRILRRFSDFLKLHASVKRAFPKKLLPVTPPKISTLWVKANDSLLEERRLALIDWLGKLLSDIDISRSTPVATFFELEAAARSAVIGNKEAQHSVNFTNEGNFASGVSSIASETEHGSDASGDVTSIDTPKAIFKQGAVMDLGSMDSKAINPDFHAYDLLKSGSKQGVLEEVFFFKDLDLMVPETLETINDLGHTVPHQGSGTEDVKGFHQRRLSLESIGSEMSSIRGSDFSFAATADGIGESSQSDAFLHGLNQNLEIFNPDMLKNVQPSVSLDQRGNVRRLLVNLQRRLNTAKADMEDLIARLNQESSVKEFLSAKVRDLEVELDSTRRKSKDLLQRALSMEQDSINNLQWELEETRASLTSANAKACEQEEARKLAEEKMKASEIEKEQAYSEVVKLKGKLQNLQKDKDLIEAKAKTEVKVLAREIKTLRKSQPELKEELEMVAKEKTKFESLLQSEKQRQEQQRIDRAKFLHEVASLRKRLQECSIEFLAKQDDKYLSKNPAVKDVMDLLMTSDNRIGLLAAEAQLLAEEKEEDKAIYNSLGKQDTANGSITSTSTAGVPDQDLQSERAIRKMLAEIFMDNVQLYKVVNSMSLNAAVMDAKPEKDSVQDEIPAKKNSSMLNRFL